MPARQGTPGLSLGIPVSVLSLRRCTQLKDLSALTALEALSSLDLSGCPGLEVKAWSAEWTVSHINRIMGRIRRHYAEPETVIPGAPAPPSVLVANLKAKGMRSQVAAIRKLIKSAEWDDVAQGIALIAAINEPALWALFASGVVLREGRVIIEDGEVKKRVKADHRINVALMAAAQTGMLDDCIELDLSDHRTLRNIKALQRATKLTTLRLGGGNGLLVDLTPLQSLTSLSALVIRSCWALVDLTPLQSLTALTALSITGCRAITDIAPIVSLPKLYSLSLSDNAGIQNLGRINELSSLVELSLRGQLSATELLLDQQPQLKTLGLTAKALERLTLRGHGALKTLELTLPSLRSITISGARSLVHLTPRSCPALQALSLDGLHALTAFEFLSHKSLAALTLRDLPALQRLRLRGCEKLTTLSQIGELPALTHLRVDYAPELGDVAALKGMSALESAELIALPKVSTLPALGGKSFLKELTLELDTFSTIDDLKALPQLKTLSLTCPLLSDLTPLSSLPSLEKLKLVGSNYRHKNPHPKSLKFWDHPTIKTVEIFRSPQLQALDMANLPALTVLKVEGKELKTARLHLLPILRSLDLINCHALSSLDFLADIPSLYTLSLGSDRHHSNDSIKRLAPLTALQSLHTVRIHNCDTLRDLDPLLEIPTLRWVTVKECRLVRFMKALAELEKRPGVTIKR